MQCDLLIRGGRAISPGTDGVPADIAIRNGKILGVLAPGSGISAGEVLDASGLVIFPGVIDVHLHLGHGKDIARPRVPEDAARETAAAAAGGVTTFVPYLMATEPFEAIFEDVDVKRRFWSDLDRVAPAGAIFASNTSSIAIHRLAEAVSHERRERFVGMHFFSPVPVMPLIELIRGRDTDDETELAIRALGERLGKQVIVSADRPGFIVNRILMPFLAESMRAYEEGLGTADDIDTGARVGLNHPMGPLELADFIGLDVCLAILNVLHEGLGDPKYRPCPLLRRMVAAGHLGRKSGRGFYVYA
jgi:3-hydroxybutyryl-CoA dehydrogenase